MDDMDDDWRTVEGPSLAAVARQWLDRGLPRESWPAWVKQYRDQYGDDRAGSVTWVSRCNGRTCMDDNN